MRYLGLTFRVGCSGQSIGKQQARTLGRAVKGLALYSERHDHGAHYIELILLRSGFCIKVLPMCQSVLVVLLWL